MSVMLEMTVLDRIGSRSRFTAIKSAKKTEN